MYCAVLPLRVHLSAAAAHTLLKPQNFTKLTCHPVRMASLQQSLRVGVRNMAGDAPLDIEAFGKAATGTGNPSKVRGDCPFSQRTYLGLEEKNVPYTATYIQEGPDKPDWFIKNNPSGLIPVLRDGSKWIQDSDKIAHYLEEKFPNPPLLAPESVKNVGTDLFPKFISWLKAKNPKDKKLKEDVVKELNAVNEHLRKHGPYIAGDQPSDSDYALVPKLRHLKVALKYYYGFEIPSEYTALNNYYQLITERPSFVKTDSPDELIIQGWANKFGLEGSYVL